MTRDLIGQRPGTLVGLMNVGLGAVLILGAPQRTSSFSFATAKSLAPVEVWGAGFLVVGLLLLFGLRLGIVVRPPSPRPR